MNEPIYTDLSIDLETLDNSPRSLILSIGAVPFNRDTGDLGIGMERHVSILSQPARTLSFGTIKWWLSQSVEAKKALFKGRVQAIPLGYALQNIFDIYVDGLADLNKVRVWGNGSAFDNAILSDAYKNSLHKSDTPIEASK
jgi:exodeoxyribonuclease VIII